MTKQAKTYLGRLKDIRLITVDGYQIVAGRITEHSDETMNGKTFYSSEIEEIDGNRIETKDGFLHLDPIEARRASFLLTRVDFVVPKDIGVTKHLHLISIRRKYFRAQKI